MRTLSKLMFLAVLALPMSRVFAADTLTVTINVTLNVTVDVVFEDTTTTQTWTIGAATLGGSANSLTDGVVTRIHNNAGFSVDVTAAVANPANWAAGAVAGLNTYSIATTPATATPLTTTPQAYQSIAPSVSSAATDKLVLSFPTSVTHVSPSGSIVVSYVATPHP